MTPINTNLTTHVLGKPANWDEARGPCVGLPVYLSDNCFFSWWKPRWIDRFRILFGRPIRLSVASSSHPPVMLDTDQ